MAMGDIVLTKACEPGCEPIPSVAPAPAAAGARPATYALVVASSKLSELGAWLLAYGGWGLFAISLLDSAFVPLPSGPDLVMITLSAKNAAAMPLYALAATLGSTLGCTILYLLARR